MSNKYGNSRTVSFLSTLKEFPSLESKNDDLTTRCKFNFSYFDSTQKAGQDFKEWSPGQLHKLLEKLKHYSKLPLEYWENQRVGAGGLKILEIYGEFPNKKRTTFSRPTHIPHQAQWGRFRLENKVRLIGFTVPSELHKTPHIKTNEYFDKNTFYIVFLDKDHKFYISEKG